MSSKHAAPALCKISYSDLLVWIDLPNTAKSTTTTVGVSGRILSILGSWWSNKGCVSLEQSTVVGEGDTLMSSLEVFMLLELLDRLMRTSERPTSHSKQTTTTGLSATGSLDSNAKPTQLLVLTLWLPTPWYRTGKFCRLAKTCNRLISSLWILLVYKILNFELTVKTSFHPVEL